MDEKFIPSWMKIVDTKDGKVLCELDNSIQYIDTGFNPRKVQAIYIGQPDGEPAKKYVELKYKYGHWIDTSFENVKVCSVCGKPSSKVGINGEAVFDYTSCPYCMAILDGGNNNGKQKNNAETLLKESKS